MRSSPSRVRRIAKWAILGVVLVLGCVGLYFGWILPDRMKQNERAASTALKTLATAQADFRANDRDGNRVNDFWTADVSSLFALQVDGRPLRLIDREVAEADAAPRQPLVAKPRPYHGYYFIALEYDNSDGLMHPYAQDTDASGIKVHNSSLFGFGAFPAEYGRTGLRSFIINEGNTMFALDLKGKRPEVWPKDDVALTGFSI